MQVNDLLKYRDKIIKTFKDGTFLSEHLKKSNDAGYKYVLEDVKKFTQEIESMSEKINLSLFEEFFESWSPADYAKMLINIKNRDENKKNVEEISQNTEYHRKRNVRFKRQRKKNEWKRKKRKKCGWDIKDY